MYCKICGKEFNPDFDDEDTCLDCKEKELCHHTEGVNYRTFWLDGIQRQGMYCKVCGQLWDYYPQY